MRNSDCKMLSYMKDVTHTQFSDGPWFTNVKSAKKKALLEGALPGEQSQTSIIQAVTAFLTNPLDFSHDTLSETHLIHVAYADKEPTGGKEGAGESAEDKQSQTGIAQS